MLQELIVQMVYYAITMFLAIGGIGALQKGFFWKYLRVRMSFGKFTLCKIRAINRDYFAVGNIEDNFLVYKANKVEKRIKIDDSTVFYKCLAVAWVDLDEVTGGLCKTDYSTINGFDAVKYQDLYVRALYRPTISDNKEKIMIVLTILTFLAVLGSIGLGWAIYQNDAIILSVLDVIKNKVVQTGIVRGGGI